MQMGSLNLVTGEGKGKDVPLAFRTALGKAAKQLRRAKRLLREDRPNRPERAVTA
jgi:ribosomal protein S5